MKKETNLEEKTERKVKVNKKALLSLMFTGFLLSGCVNDGVHNKHGNTHNQQNNHVQHNNSHDKKYTEYHYYINHSCCSGCYE